MYNASAQGIDERAIHVHYYCYKSPNLGSLNVSGETVGGL